MDGWAERTSDKDPRSVGRIALPLILDILSPSSALLISAPPEGFLRPNDAYLWETGLSAPSTFIDSTLSTPPGFV